jgi:hypothetical protein
LRGVDRRAFSSNAVDNFAQHGDVAIPAAHAKLDLDFLDPARRQRRERVEPDRLAVEAILRDRELTAEFVFDAGTDSAA